MSKLTGNSVQALLAGLERVKSVVNTAQAAPQLLHSEERALQSLSSCTEGLDSFLSVSREPSARQLRKEVKVLHNTLTSLASGIENEDLDPEEFLESLTGEVNNLASSIEIVGLSMANESDISDAELGIESESASTELSDFKKLPDQEVDVADAVNTVRKLNRYDSYRNALARKLQKPFSVQPVDLPIVVRFQNNRLNMPAVLESVFPGRVDPVGVTGKTAADIGIVLQNQIVVQFSKSYAMELAQELMTEDDTAERLSNARTVLNNLRKRERALNKDLEKLAEEEATLGKKMTKITRTRIEKQRAQIFANLAKLEDPIKQNMDRVKEAQSVKRSKAKVALKPEAAYMTRLTMFLEELSARGKNYTTLSNTFLTSPANSDLVLAWLVPTASYTKLANLSGSNTAVTSWGLPWSGRKAVVRSTVDIPDGVFLPTKVRKH